MSWNNINCNFPREDTKPCTQDYQSFKVIFSGPGTQFLLVRLYGRSERLFTQALVKVWFTKRVKPAYFDTQKELFGTRYIF